jgi:hypothetical protein
MTTLQIFLLSPAFSAGPLGTGILLLAILDAWLHYRMEENQRIPFFASLAVRFVFLFVCFWVIAIPVLGMSAAHKCRPPGEEWSSFGTTMGMIGPADDTLRILVDIVLAAFCLWIIVTLFFHAMRFAYVFCTSYLKTKRLLLPSIRDIKEFVSMIILLMILGFMRIALLFLHPF